MESDRKRVPRLRQLTNLERATSRKASESWQMFTIMAEFIDAAERLSEIRPAVSMFAQLSSGMRSYWRLMASDTTALYSRESNATDATRPTFTPAIVTGAPGVRKPGLARMPEVIHAISSFVENAVKELGPYVRR